MNIVVICRTRNEARNIKRFCQAYQWADSILIADGGSDDDTVGIAWRQAKTKVRNFDDKIFNGDRWRNPHGKHINFMIEWAKAEGANWIIFDDCDCVPTRALQQNARGILGDTPNKVVSLYRLYVWGSNEYFPEQNEPGQSLWAWRPDVPIRASETDPWQHTMIGWQQEDELRLEPPHACLHYFCPDKATVKRKLNFYRESGEQIDAVHPLENCGPLASLPDWAKWR